MLHHLLIFFPCFCCSFLQEISQLFAISVLFPGQSIRDLITKMKRKDLSLVKALQQRKHHYQVGETYFLAIDSVWFIKCAT